MSVATPQRSFFVDTNVLLGLTFFSDMWWRDARPLYEYDHPLHTSELVVYEYCVSPHPFTDPPADPSKEQISWAYDRGTYGVITNRLKRPYREYRQRIREIDREDDLTLERAIELFIELFEIRPDAEPQICSEFKYEFDQKPVTGHYVQQFVSRLLGKIFKKADEVKNELSKLVEVHDSVYHMASDTKRRWKDFPERSPDEPDLSIITDATHVMNRDSVDFVLSGDSDFTVLQEIAGEYFEFSILSLAEEYSQVASGAED